jgi:hypothetical protein
MIGYDWVKSPLAPETVATEIQAQSQSATTQSSGNAIASSKSATSSGVSDSVVPTLDGSAVPSVPHLPEELTQTYYAPIRLCFLDTISQIRVIKSALIETDIEVFKNMRDEYHRALNPFSRLVPSLLPTKILVKLEGLRIWKLIAGGFQKACIALWVRICPVFRKCSLWDLKEIREAKVNKPLTTF